MTQRSDLVAPRSETRPPPRRGMVLAAATLGFGVIQLDVSVVNVAVKPIGAALGGGVSGVQWVVDAYTLVFAALILSAGALGDRSGHKRLLMAGFAVFTPASAACGLVPAIGELIAARAVQGAGAAALGASSLSLINHTYPDAAGRARAVSVWTAGGAATLAAGPLIGGLLIATVGWRSIFFINLPLGALGWWLTRRYATTTPADPGRRTDLPGQVTAIIALTALAGSTIEAGSAGSRLPLVYGGYALAAAAGTAFIAIEHARERPMLPLSLFRMRAFSTAACAGLLVNLVFFGLIFAFSLFLQRQQGLSPLATGLAFLPVTVLIVVSNLVAGRILPARGTRAVAWAGALLMGAGCLAMLGLLAARAGPLVPALIAGLSLTGFGIGLVVTAITSALLGSVAPAQSGIASGTFTAFRQTGSVLGVALFGTLLAGLHPSTGLEVTFAIGAGLAAVVAGLGHAAALPSGPPGESQRKAKRRHMGNCHCPTGNAPVTPARQPFGIAVIGGPTVVIDVVGTRLVIDPGLDPAGDYGFIRETTGPAVPASVLANTDIILLRHDRHRSSTELGTSSGAHGKSAVRGTAPTESETR